MRGKKPQSLEICKTSDRLADGAVCMTPIVSLHCESVCPKLASPGGFAVRQVHLHTPGATAV